MDYSSKPVQIEGNFAVQLTAGELRVVGPDGRLFLGLGGLIDVSMGSVTAADDGLRIVLLFPPKLLLPDPTVAPLTDVYLGSPISLQKLAQRAPHLRANTIYRRQGGSTKSISYRRIGTGTYGADLHLPKYVEIARQRGGVFRLSSPGSYECHIDITAAPASRHPLTFIPISGESEDLAYIDRAIHWLVATDRPSAIIAHPAGWLMSAEAAFDEVEEHSLAWLVGKAIDEMPTLGEINLPKLADGSDIEAASASTEALARAATDISRTAADRYLYDHYFGTRLQALAKKCKTSILEKSHQAALAALASRLETRVEFADSNLPKVLRSHRFQPGISTAGADPAATDDQLKHAYDSLDNLDLWSLFRARSIIRTYLEKINT